MNGSRGASVKENLSWGFLCGSVVAALLSLFIIVFRGDGTALKEVGLTLPQALAIYWGGALLGGLILGACRPILDRLFGKVIAGVLGIFPMAVLYQWTTTPAPLWELLGTSAAIATFIGPIYAICWHFYEKSESKSSGKQ